MKYNNCGELAVISMKGCETFCNQVDNYLKEWRKHGGQGEHGFLASADCPRFGSGEGKAIIHESMRGKDVYIICDVFNYGVTYKMYGQNVPMSPDDHYADLKRIIAAIGGKAKRITVIMPMLYEGRQHKRSGRESLDCALMLQELVSMGVSNILTFDAHDSRISNAIPLSGFDNVQPTYQMIKALVRAVPDVQIDKDHMAIISPDEGAMSRCMYYSSVLGLDIGMFYKRRNYSIVINGRNPIEAHEYLGQDLHGKDAIVVDDMISSGDSMLDVCRQLKERGANRVFCCATFGLFTEGCDNFDKAFKEGVFDRVLSTNLIYHRPELTGKPWFVDVNMCKYVAYLIDSLNDDATISSLLNPVKRIQTLMEKHRKDLETQLKIDFDKK
ncbi:MAG: ribose-phosphate pyrophosphokinase [Ruminococcaceae bacterium]|nr:ribose-phosphate pyrophosphokinase [Oscillospiraceae bacterium]